MFLLLFVPYEGEKLEGLKARKDNTAAKVAPNGTEKGTDTVWVGQPITETQRGSAGL